MHRVTNKHGKKKKGHPGAGGAPFADTVQLFRWMLWINQETEVGSMLCTRRSHHVLILPDEAALLPKKCIHQHAQVPWFRTPQPRSRMLQAIVCMMIKPKHECIFRNIMPFLDDLAHAGAYLDKLLHHPVVSAIPSLDPVWMPSNEVSANPIIVQDRCWR